jgi:hypothetical protein
MSYFSTQSKPPPLPIGQHHLIDGYGMRYRFWRYPIGQSPEWYDSVYAFVRHSLVGVIHTPMIEYIGKAERTKERLGNHDRIAAARRRGATEVWVHPPVTGDPIDYHEVERRLISFYDPPMNKQHPVPFALLGGLGGLGGYASEPQALPLSALGTGFGTLAPQGLKALGDLGRS